MKKHFIRYNQQEDDVLLPYIKEIADQRGSYGYRRITWLLNIRLRKEGKKMVNHKRVYRIMKLHNLLLPAYRKKSVRSHDGKIITLRSNTRWCSDTFTIQCQNGDRVFVAFALDTCDREVLGYIASTIGVDGAAIRDLMIECVEYRFGKVGKLPGSIQWLTDNVLTLKSITIFGKKVPLAIAPIKKFPPYSNPATSILIRLTFTIVTQGPVFNRGLNCT